MLTSFDLFVPQLIRTGLLARAQAFAQVLVGVEGIDMYHHPGPTRVCCLFKHLSLFAALLALPACMSERLHCCLCVAVCHISFPRGKDKHLANLS